MTDDFKMDASIVEFYAEQTDALAEDVKGGHLTAEQAIYVVMAIHSDSLTKCLLDVHKWNQRLEVGFFPEARDNPTLNARLQKDADRLAASMTNVLGVIHDRQPGLWELVENSEIIAISGYDQGDDLALVNDFEEEAAPVQGGRKKGRFSLDAPSDGDRLDTRETLDDATSREDLKISDINGQLNYTGKL